MAKANKLTGIDEHANVVDGALLVLRARLDEMSGLREKALDWSDIEGVHDMRVASRRVRSAARDFAPYFRRRHLRPWRTEVKVVADALGQVRDQDVALAALEKLAQEAPPEVTQGIAGFINLHRQQLEKARAKLVPVISEEALADLRASASAALERAAQVRQSGGRGEAARQWPSFQHAGRDIILQRWHELEALSDSLYHPHATKALHDMRIAAKRVRYAVELFAQCCGESITAFAKEISEMQSSLGEMHDCDLWLEEFGEFLSRPPGKHLGEAATQNSGVNETAWRAAAVWLLHHFMQARTKHFRAALARWHKWETNDFGARLAERINAGTATSAVVAQKSATSGP